MEEDTNENSENLEAQEGLVFQLKDDEFLPDGMYLLYSVEDGHGLFAPVDGIDFEDALEIMRFGYRVARASWPDNSWILIVPGDNWDFTGEAPFIEMTKEHTRHPWIVYNSGDEFSPWAPTSTDILGSDWLVRLDMEGLKVVDKKPEWSALDELVLKEESVDDDDSKTEDR